MSIKKFKNPWGKGSNEYNKWLKDFENNFHEENENIDNLAKGLSSFGSNGFLSVKTNTGNIISIVHYCKVINVKFNADKSREEFKILDWPHSNVLASSACESKGISRFSNIKYEAAATIFFNKSKGELILGSIKVPAYTSESDPIQNGNYNIWLPDYFHEYGNPYLNSSKYAGLWFRLGSETSDRYLHVGSVSLGCVSVGKSDYSDKSAEYSKWNDVYNYLCKRRSNNKHVGQLIVS